MALTTRTIDSFGVDRFVVGRFLFKGESEPLPFVYKVGTTPIDLTNYTFTFRLQKQLFDSARDTTKGGFEVLGRKPDPDSVELNLDTYVTKTDAVNGRLLLEIPTLVTTIGADQYGTPTIYSGFFTLEDNASAGELIQKIPFLIAVK